MSSVADGYRLVVGGVWAGQVQIVRDRPVGEGHLGSSQTFTSQYTRTRDRCTRWVMVLGGGV